MTSLKQTIALAIAGLVVAVATTSAWAAPYRGSWPIEVDANSSNPDQAPTLRSGR